MRHVEREHRINNNRSRLNYGRERFLAPHD